MVGAQPRLAESLGAVRGAKHYHRGQRFDTIEEARAYCQEWNRHHDPGRLSNKCEFEEA